jgi:homoserine kinase
VHLRIRVPGSTSNLGPGFDCLGLALELDLAVEVWTVPQGLQIETGGLEKAHIPVHSANLVYASMSRVLRRAGKPNLGVRLRIESDIPMSRGLGSSGAAILAGVLAGHLLASETPPDPDIVLRDAVEIEGHPDNVAPALLGGLVASALDGERVRAVRLPFPADLDVLLVIPDHEVSTEAARLILPHSVPLPEVVFNLSHLALLIGSLCNNEMGLLRVAMQDHLHQKHRLPMVPGLAQALEALLAEPACVGTALSGSGPTLLAFTQGAGADDAGDRAANVLRQHGISARVRRVRPQLSGARWERLQSA